MVRVYGSSPLRAALEAVRADAGGARDHCVGTVGLLSGIPRVEHFHSNLPRVRDRTQNGRQRARASAVTHLSC